MLDIKIQRNFLVFVCAATLVMGGCRSAGKRSGLNFFARGDSAIESLAEATPDTKYPSPPSATASPQAIASVAGGTADPTPSSAGSTSVNAQLASASLGSSPAESTGSGSRGSGSVSSGSESRSTNLAAAQANGIYGQPQTAPTPASNVPAYAGSTSGSSGYTFGDNTFTPKPTTDSPTSKSAYSRPDAVASNTFAIPAPDQPASSANQTVGSGTRSPLASGSGATGQPTAGSGVNGFSLPGGSGVPDVSLTQAIDSLTLPSQPTATSIAPPPSLAASASAKPSAVADAGTQVAASTVASAAGYGTTTFSSGTYRPGSTGQASSYPGSNTEAPSTSGTFFR